MSFSGKTFALSMGFNLFITMILGLGMVWLNMERVHLAYALKGIQSKVDEKNQLLSKLETERETLITPDKLRVSARAQNMGPAKPGQIRYLTDAGDEVNVLRPQAAANIPLKKTKSKAVDAHAAPEAKPAKEGKDAKAKAGASAKTGKDGKARADAAQPLTHPQSQGSKSKPGNDRTPKALDFDPAN